MSYIKQMLIYTVYLYLKTEGYNIRNLLLQPLLLGEGSFLNNLPHKNIQEDGHFGVELILPIDKNIGSIEQYCFKEKIKIVNALKLVYVGTTSGLQIACNEMNQYILENTLQPITVGYNVTKYIAPMNIDNTEIDVYVEISPNIL